MVGIHKGIVGECHCIGGGGGGGRGASGHVDLVYLTRSTEKAINPLVRSTMRSVGTDDYSLRQWIVQLHKFVRWFLDFSHCGSVVLLDVLCAVLNKRLETALVELVIC